jgi:hypothetical protein
MGRRARPAPKRERSFERRTLVANVLAASRMSAAKHLLQAVETWLARRRRRRRRRKLRLVPGGAPPRSSGADRLDAARDARPPRDASALRAVAGARRVSAQRAP